MWKVASFIRTAKHKRSVIMFNVTYGIAIITWGNSEMFSAENITSCASSACIENAGLLYLYSTLIG